MKRILSLIRNDKFTDRSKKFRDLKKVSLEVTLLSRRSYIIIRGNILSCDNWRMQLAVIIRNEIVIVHFLRLNSV